MDRCAAGTRARCADPLGVLDLTTHQLPLSDAPSACEMFQAKKDGAVKIVLKP
jgi:threonine dehydrogenase-like Zn-dependent dehydrogenase